MKPQHIDYSGGEPGEDNLNHPYQEVDYDEILGDGRNLRPSGAYILKHTAKLVISPLLRGFLTLFIKKSSAPLKYSCF